MNKSPSSTAIDAYLELVKQFPLRRLKTESQRAEAVRVYGKVSLQFQGTKDAGVLDYLDLLAGLIDQYEHQARLKVDTSHKGPADLIRHLIAVNELTISELAKQIGVGQSNLSEMLSGRRDFSKAAIAGLCNRFHLDPILFF